MNFYISDVIVVHSDSSSEALGVGGYLDIGINDTMCNSDPILRRRCVRCCHILLPFQPGNIAGYNGCLKLQQKLLYQNMA
jgi:hypothetical protein